MSSAGSAMPIGSIGNNRIDARDIADCAVRVLTEDGHAGKETNQRTNREALLLSRLLSRQADLCDPVPP